jgi:single-strand DNA-binding protein
MNKIMLIGNLGRDPEMSYTPNGVPVTKFSLAVRRRGSPSSTGERQDETDWFNIVAWQKLAETCNTYLRKGSKVFIEGRLAVRRYTDKSGIERTALDVIINDMEMLTPKDRPSTPTTGESDFLNIEGEIPGDLEEHPF